MARRNKATLFNPTWEEMVEREPLLAFSFYLSGRVNVLLDLGEEIIALLDEGFAADCVYSDKIERAGTLMWLWTLGAYEVVRTISQASVCFSASAQERFQSLKRTLSQVRVPAAKMEKPGKRTPVTSNRSPVGFDMRNRDILIGDPESPTMIRARALLTMFDDSFSSLRADDVVGRHEESYST